MLCWKDMLTNLSCSLLDQSWFAARPFLLALWFEFKACSLLPNSMAEKRRSWISTRLTCGPLSVPRAVLYHAQGASRCWRVLKHPTRTNPANSRSLDWEYTDYTEHFEWWRPLRPWVSMGLHGDQASSRYVVELPEGSTKRLGSILEWWRSWDQSKDAENFWSYTAGYYICM